ncbi:MAG: hypothetical protein AAF480_02350 [Actinomycetota bacterium]
MSRPRILIVVPSGEAVRNFLYSATLERLAADADVTLLTVVHDDAFVTRFGPMTTDIVPLGDHPEHGAVTRFRHIVHTAHMRWRWSKVFQNNWELRSAEAAAGSTRDRLRWRFLRTTARVLANRRILDVMTAIDRRASVRLRPTQAFDELFDEIRPDLVFNGMHVHGPRGDLPCRIAAARGIPTAAFIYSWDNLTSRSRIFVPYDDFLVWNDRMKGDLVTLYPQISPDHVHVTGTPQFDFHRRTDQLMDRAELAESIGFDPARPFVLYTTGVDRHFREEHLTVEHVAASMAALDLDPRPQLVVRTYVKGTSPEMRDLMERGLPDTVFPTVEWDERWFTPTERDLRVYSSLLHECAVGINAASTVSLELLALDKPVINLGFDPPGSRLGWPDRWIRHIEFDHFAHVAESQSTMIAMTPDEIGPMLHRGLTDPGYNSETRRSFIADFMGPAFDGTNGERAAEALLRLARR